MDSVGYQVSAIPSKVIRGRGYALTHFESVTLLKRLFFSFKYFFMFIVLEFNVKQIRFLKVCTYTKVFFGNITLSRASLL